MPSESSKKRASERQLTKDDRLEEEEDDDENEEDPAGSSGGFQRASEDTLKARRIVRVARTATGELDLSKKANPFAAVKLASAGTSANEKDSASAGDDADAAKEQAPVPTSSTTKVFGAVAKFSGFGTAAASSSSSAGNSTTTTGFTFTGFGTSGSKPGLGFGNAKGFGEVLSAGFATNKEQSSTNASSTTEIQQSGKAVAQLPEHYDLKSGEEDEVVLFEKRCKSYRWAKVVRETANNGNAEGSNIHAVPHALTAFSDKGTTPGGNENESGKASAGDAGEQFEWVEVGIGPIKVLRHVETNYTRIVQRRQPDLSGPITKVIVNMGLPVGSTVLTQPSDKHVQVSTVASGMHLFKFKLTSEATLFKQVLDENLVGSDDDGEQEKVHHGKDSVNGESSQNEETTRAQGTVSEEPSTANDGKETLNASPHETPQNKS